MPPIPCPTAARRAPRAPGPRGNWLLGSLFPFRKNPVRFLVDLHAASGDVARFRIGPQTVHVVSHPRDLRHVLQDHAKDYTRTTHGYALLRVFLGNGLLTSDGEGWRRKRRLAQPSFHRDALASFLRLMARAANDLCDTWATATARGETIDASAAMVRITLRVASEALLSTDLTEASSEIGSALTTCFAEVARRFTGIDWPLAVPTARNRRYRRAIATLNALVTTLVAERRRSPDTRPDLLSMLIAARDTDTGDALSNAEIVDEVKTILLAGHETTAHALAWAFYVVARHPEVWTTLHAEATSALGSASPHNIDLAHLAALPFARATLEETMRLYPPIWATERRAEADDVIGGFHIPRGSNVIVSPYVTHRHAEFWPDATRFDPARFLAPAKATIDRFAYLPFSSGPHQCIGNSFALMEATTILASVAARFRWRLVPDAEIPPVAVVTLRPRRPIQLALAAAHVS
ncbi:MAG: cytochrome P450 [Deltaproteobacteria bacterium]|nr:cytochrome P450 [Deltaproteobacteria bacterium]